MANTANVSSTESNSNPEKLPIREELVDTAIKFLQNPKVINSPLAQKQTFLQRRGLTEDEIRLACEKSGAYNHHEATKLSFSPEFNQSSPISNNNVITTSYRGYGPLRISWFDNLREILHSVAIFSVVAYIIKKFYENYVAPYLFGTKKKSLDQKLDNLEKNVEESMKDLQQNLDLIRSEVDKISYTSETKLTAELKDLKSEIASVKGLLLTRKQFPAVGTIPAWQMSSVQANAETEAETEERKDNEELLEIGSGSGSSEPEHGMKTSESSLEIISSKDCDSESCHSKKSSREGNITD